MNWSYGLLFFFCKILIMQGQYSYLSILAWISAYANLSADAIAGTSLNVGCWIWIWQPYLARENKGIFPKSMYMSDIDVFFLFLISSNCLFIYPSKHVLIFVGAGAWWPICCNPENTRRWKLLLPQFYVFIPCMLSSEHITTVFDFVIWIDLVSLSILLEGGGIHQFLLVLKFLVAK